MACHQNYAGWILGDSIPNQFFPEFSKNQCCCSALLVSVIRTADWIVFCCFGMLCRACMMHVCFGDLYLTLLVGVIRVTTYSVIRITEGRYPKYCWKHVATLLFSSVSSELLTGEFCCCFTMLYRTCTLRVQNFLGMFS